jgi:hypothetical protein
MRLAGVFPVVLLTLGCVSTGAAQSTAPSAPPTTAPVSVQETDPLDEETAPPGNGAETFLAWIVGLGPGSPEGPTQVDTYQLIQDASQANCRAALNPVLEVPETRALYHGAAAACLAALHGKTARWEEAQTAFDSLPGRPAGCVDQATYDLLELILTAHAADPDARFSLDGEPAEGSADRIRLRCLRIDKVNVTRGNAGLEIAVTGNRLDQAIAISYAGVESCPQARDFESPLKLTPTGGKEAISATIEGDAATAAASEWMWVGVLSEPTDWVAASDCVRVEEPSPS